MKKLILIVLVSIFTLNCSKDTNSTNPKVEDQEQSNDGDDGNNSQDSDNPPISNTLKIEVEGLDEIDYTKIQVFTPNGLSDIKDDGSFESEFKNSDIEKLPLIFVDDADKILFGYYPETIIDNKVTIDDILLFCFLNMPEVAMREVEFSEGLDFLKSDINYESLKTLITDALNKNEDVLDDITFIDKISATVNLYVESLETSSLTGKSSDIDDFEIIYSRDGKITIPEEVPIFSALGVEIRDSITNEYLVDDYILKSNSLVLNSTSFAYWFRKEFFSDEISNPTKTFNLNKDGIYVVKFTNGKSFDKVSEKVVEVNKEYFISTLAAYALPKGLKTMITQEDKCLRSIDELIVNRTSDFIRFTENGISEDELYSIARGTILDVGSIVLTCTSNETLKKYLSFIIDRVLKITDILKDGLELLRFTRDFFYSEIEDSEVRYFDNNLSYSNLKYTSTTGSELQGEKGTDFRYEGIVEESKSNYKIEINNSNFFGTTTFTKQEELAPAQGLPFQVALNSGDAILNGSNPIISDENGRVILEGQFGEQDSEIEIRPFVLNTGIQNRLISITPENSTGSFTDSRDGEIYKWVKIGEKKWMAENLRFFIDGAKINREAPDSNHALLYDWKTLTNNSGTVRDISAKIQGICPTGWRIPNMRDWIEFTWAINNNRTGNIVRLNENKVRTLLSDSGWIGLEANNLNNSSGFSAYPVSWQKKRLNSNYDLFSYGYGTYFWTANGLENVPYDNVASGITRYLIGFGKLNIDKIEVFIGNTRFNYRSYDVVFASCRCIED